MSEEYPKEAHAIDLMDGETIHHKCFDDDGVDMLNVLFWFNEEVDIKKRTRINELLADAIKKYDCAELTIAIENELEACL